MTGPTPAGLAHEGESGRAQLPLRRHILFWSAIVVFPLFWLVTGAFKQQHDIFPNA